MAKLFDMSIRAGGGSWILLHFQPASARYQAKMRPESRLDERRVAWRQRARQILGRDLQHEETWTRCVYT
jgi:hypothetical protein